MTATPEFVNTAADKPHQLLGGLQQQARYAHYFARTGQTTEALEHAQAIEGLLAAYRVAIGDLERDAVHKHFGLSYANYLVIPRTLPQSAPQAWQARFVALLSQLETLFSHVPQAAAYDVTAGTSMLLDDMTDSQLHAAGIDVQGDDEDGPGAETRYHRRSDGAELCRNDSGFLPGKDPVPHYNRGRTRIEPRLGGGE
ncbi:hypothetical protein P1P75_33500 [Streptomyces sp. ID05-39B]|uniref:hypothetical protein n=1 Tax=Streptomyces sp. ID05-39B TaxID=3028664 RepID=UPI0029AB11B0|nr:hypothetical protein [Streptomyces sp. ID05-39B]MDX3531190.1 hypothetical protein [Streptomyces sp. ID05-39B]